MSPLNLDVMLLAQETVTAGENLAEIPEVSSAMGWGVFLIVIAALVLPFVLGNLLANALKMKSAATRISIVLLALTLAVSPFLTALARNEKLSETIDLGIDLAGGTNLVFAVDRKAAEADGKSISDDLMDKMVGKVKQRVNPTGTEEVTVRRVGADRIEVIVPGADQERVRRVIDQVNNLGNLEFALIANYVNHQALIDLAQQVGPGGNVYRDGKLVGMWRRPALDADGIQKYLSGANRVAYRAVPQDENGNPKADADGNPIREYLVVVDPDPEKRITGRLLVGVRPTITEKGWAVSFTFNNRGGFLFGQVTSRNLPQEGEGFFTHLAVLLDDRIHSAPTINARITTSGVIEGRFTEEEVNTLADVLNAGALEVPLIKEPVTEATVSALLGKDVQQKGFLSIGIAVAAVFIFTLVYYLKAGFVADVCLALNILLVMGAMSMIDATFTLPGLAGLVLTIGMAVDANVLIFERMREEQARGSSIRMSVKNGFEKAFSTIFDSNITTLLTAVVLYYIGTDQVKGFAVTLFIGILTSMFSTLYIGRLIFDIAEQKRWLKDLRMMSLVSAQGVNFLGKKQIAFAASGILIVGGLIAVGMRGNDNLDIDFRGGSMVTFGFEGETPEEPEVRALIEPKFEESISIEQLTVKQTDEAGTVIERKLYRLRTVVGDTSEVSQKIKSAFADSKYSLEQQHLTIDTENIATITELDPSSQLDQAFLNGHTATVKVTQKMTPGALADDAVAVYAAQKNLSTSDVTELIESVQAGGKTDEIALGFSPTIDPAEIPGILTGLKAELERDPHFEEINSFDQSVTGDAKWAAITAMVVSLLIIVGYLWIRFQRVTFGIAACAALVHDVLIVLGMVAIGAYLSGTPLSSIFLLEDFKINLPIIAAFLTIIGYSLNDTIVVFDRIREIRGRNPALTEEMVNTSLNQTLSRTILTSLTTFIVVVILYVMGGEGIHGFAYCLMLGIIVGTYSSIYVAAPILVWLMNRDQKKVASV